MSRMDAPETSAQLAAPAVETHALQQAPYYLPLADEVEVFLAAYLRIGELRDAAAFAGWIAAIARNRATDHLRQSREQVELPDELPGGDPIEAETLAVLDAVRKLPETYRETLLMRLVEGMTGNEIAERTGLTPASVRVHLHRGMKLLREKLGMAKP